MSLKTLSDQEILYFRKIVKVIDTSKIRSNRIELIRKFGYDVKFAYHVVRLVNEAEQILMEGDLDLQRSKEMLKSIRRGEWTEKQLYSWFTDRELHLSALYDSSTIIPKFPDEEKIKKILLSCLEEHYGSLDKCVVEPDLAKKTISEIADILDRYTRRQNA